MGRQFRFESVEPYIPKEITMFYSQIRLANRFVSAALMVAAMFVSTAFSQGFDSIEKGRMKGILKIVKNEIKKNYYDPNFHGIDIEARFKTAEEKLSAATSTTQSLGIIAQAVIDFNDSHLFLIPPSTGWKVDYGWRSTFFGDKCIITDVKPGSDADAKGIKRGDELIAIGGFRVNRKEMWKVNYFYNTISKRKGMSLTVLSPGAAEPRTLEIASELKQGPRVITFSTYFRFDDDFYNEENDKHRFMKIGGINIWRMPGWDFDPNMVDSLMGRVNDGTSIIMDLRGNGGGYVKTLEALAGHFVPKDVQIAELKGRKKMEPQKAKSKGESRYKGKLVVLIDSESGSASEIFARLVQLEKLGVVMGDVSAGAVMQSQTFDQEMGADNIVPFAISVTNADVIMSDGKSLEHVGVTPDELIIPTATDLAAGRDVVMARAIESLGGKVDPIEAGKWFPYYWKKG